MNLIADTIYTIKVNSGEELVTKYIKTDNNEIVVSNPVSVAPSQQGIGLINSLFTAEAKGEVRININSVMMYAVTEENIKNQYVAATCGISLPSKKLILG